MDDAGDDAPRANRYPVDYDAIEKGDVIPEEQLVEIIGEPSGTYSYQYKLAGFIKELERELWDRGKPLSVCWRRRKDAPPPCGDVLILSDAEASEYNKNRFDRHRRGLARSHVRLLAVDVERLNDDQRRAHDRTVAIQGMTLAAIITARTEAIPRGRQPELLGPE